MSLKLSSCFRTYIAHCPPQKELTYQNIDGTDEVQHKLINQSKMFDKKKRHFMYYCNQPIRSVR
jgi:hypothetical protein